MKLACIINVWDGTEILKYSMKSVKDRVDIFIIVFQNISNFGEYSPPLSEMELEGYKYRLIYYSPKEWVGFKNEREKRNLGLMKARELECTHFFFLDVDECYLNFSRAVNEYIESGADGSVCNMYTYFKEPTLRFENFDNYYVPFIHKLHPNTLAGAPVYPYYVDPTRKVSSSNVVLISEPMHHFSYVRKDIDKKVRNSSAKSNIEKSNLLRDYYDPSVGPGFFVKDFNQKLIEVPNHFKIVI